MQLMSLIFASDDVVDIALEVSKIVIIVKSICSAKTIHSHS